MAGLVSAIPSGRLLSGNAVLALAYGGGRADLGLVDDRDAMTPVATEFFLNARLNQGVPPSTQQALAALDPPT